MANTNTPGAAASGAAGDDFGGSVNPQAIKVGHEADSFAVLPILSVPGAVVFAFVVAFITVTILFTYMLVQRKDPFDNPQAVAANEAGENARLARIDRMGSDGNPDVKSDNARLEPLRQLEGDGKTITRPPLPQGYNSPELHPQDIHPALRPLMVPALHKSGKLADGTTHITIDNAMSKATGSRRAEVLPTRKKPITLFSTGKIPTGANSGRGVMTPVPATAGTPKTDAPKTDAPKNKEAVPPQKEVPQSKEPKKDNKQPKPKS